MKNMALDFLQQPIEPVASTHTMIMTQATTVETESYLLVSVLCGMCNSRVAGIAELIPMYEEFIDLAYLSLPVATDTRQVLLKFFAFEKRLKAVMQVDDFRWTAAWVQMQRVKDAIFLIETVDDESVVDLDPSDSGEAA